MTCVIIDVFVYSWSFLVCYLDTKHARILSFTNHYYNFDITPCLVEAHCKLSMIFRYALYHPPSKFCKYACHCELHLYFDSVWVSWYICFIVLLFLIKRMLDDILFELTLMYCDSVWEAVQVCTLTLLYCNLILFGMLFFEITLVYLGIPN